MNEKIKELYVGQEFKNYKIFCKFMDEEPKKANSKISQIKEWNRYFLFKKEGQKIIITKIFDIPKDKIDNRGGNNLGHYRHPNLGIYNLTDEQNDLKGVYKIQLNDTVYIGSTIASFKTRYRQHCIDNDVIPYTHDLLEKGATFDILWIADKNNTEENIRMNEYNYIKEYINQGYDVLNTHVPIILSENRPVVSKKKKPTYKNIKINKEDYEKAIALLTENGLRIAI